VRYDAPRMMLGSAPETGPADWVEPRREPRAVRRIIAIGTILGGLAWTATAGAQATDDTEPAAPRETSPPGAEDASDDEASAGPPEDAPGETEPSAEPAASNRPSVEDTDYAVRLRGLEERVNELKERIFRSKARLLLLRETVLNGVISGARARIVHVNDVGSAFDLEEVSYALDGSPLFSKTSEDGNLDDRREIELFNGSIVPGNHNISLSMRFRGNGYGVFSYLRAYRFNIQSSYAFTAEEGQMTTVEAIAYEKGGFTTDLQDRLAIRYEESSKRDARTQETEARAEP